MMVAKNKGRKQHGSLSETPSSHRGAYGGKDTSLEVTNETALTPGEWIIMELVTQLHDKFNNMQPRLDTIEAWKTEASENLTSLEVSTGVLERRVSRNEAALDKISNATGDYGHFKECAISTIAALERQVEAMDTRMWAQNLHVLGIPRLEEGEDLKETLQHFIRESVLLTPETTHAEILTAFRLTTRSHKRDVVDGEGTIIVLLRDALAERSFLAKQGTVLFHNSLVFCFPDVNKEMPDKHLEVRKLCQELISKGLIISTG